MTLGRNILWGFSESLLRLCATFFVNIFIARHLGPEGYGVLTTAFIVVSWVSAFGGLGLDTIVIREFSASEFKSSEIFASAYRLRLIAAVFATGVLAIFGIFSVNSIESLKISVWGPILIMFVLIPFQPIAFGMGNALTAYLRADLLTVAKSTGLIVGTLARVLGLISGLSMLYFAFCFVIEHLVSTIVVRIRYLQEILPKLGESKPSDAATKILVEGGKWLFLSALVVAVIQGAGVVVLNIFSSDLETGIYSGALRLALVLQFIPSIICKTFLPLIIAKQQKSTRIAAGVEQELFKLLWLFGYGVSAFFLMFGDYLVPFILGKEFSASAAPLKILALMLIPLSVGAARSVYFTKDRAYHKLMMTDLVGALLTVGLSCLFVGSWGANGVAVASLIAATVGYLVVPYLILEKGKKSSKVVLGAALCPFPNFRLLLNLRLSS